MTADFNWFLNKQGPRGQQGVKGEQGFSPVITVAEDTAKAYILRIQTQDDTFLTPNLRGTVEDLGGTYVRYNPETGQVYAGSPDVATTEAYGVIRLATQQDVTDLAQDAAVTPELLANQIKALDLPNNYVTTNTAQTINALKAFKNGISLSSIRNLDGTEVLDFLSGTPYKIKTWGNGLSVQGGVLRIEDGSIKSKSTKQPSTDANVYDVVTAFDLATTENAGIVKPDGSTVFIDENGVISAKSSEIDDANTSTQSTWSSSKINSEITTVAQEVVNVQGDVASLDADMSVLKPKVETNHANIVALNDSLTIAMSDINELKGGKQDKLTAGNNITIEGNVISATGGAGGSGTQIKSADGTEEYSELALGDTLAVAGGVLNANLDEIGNEVNTLAVRVTTVENEIAQKQDKLNAKSPLKIDTVVSEQMVGFSVDSVTGLMRADSSQPDVMSFGFSRNNTITTSSVQAYIKIPYTIGQVIRLPFKPTSQYSTRYIDKGTAMIAGWYGHTENDGSVTPIFTCNVRTNENSSSYDTSNSYGYYNFANDGTGLWKANSSYTGAHFPGTVTGNSDMPVLYTQVTIDTNDTKTVFDMQFPSNGYNNPDYTNYWTAGFDLPSTDTLNSIDCFIYCPPAQEYIDQKLFGLFNVSGRLGPGMLDTITNKKPENLFSLESADIKYLQLNIGDGLSVVDGKLTATSSSSAPEKMVTTDTEQTITGLKTFSAGIKGKGYIENIGLTDLIYTDNSKNPHVGNISRTLTVHTNPIGNGRILINDGSANYEDLHTGNIANFIDGTSITFTNNKLSATGGGATPENMVTTDTAQEITGSKLFSNGLKVGGYAGISDNNGVQFIYVDPSHNGWTIGSQNSGGWFSNVHIKRGASGDYINIDSGNISDYVPYTITKLTQSEYDALATKDDNTMYVIVG